MKAKNNLITEDDGFSRGAIENILESENNQNTSRSIGKGRHSPLQRRISVALILFMLSLFIIRISSAQESFPKMAKPNLLMNSPETCLDLLSQSFTEDQKKALESLQRTYMAEAMPIRTELLSLRIGLRYLLSDPNVRPRLLFDQQREISALQAKFEDLSLSYLIKVRSVFTKEQLERLPQGWAYEMGLRHEIPILDRGPRPRRGLQ